MDEFIDIFGAILTMKPNKVIRAWTSLLENHWDHQSDIQSSYTQKWLDHLILDGSTQGPSENTHLSK
jgi:hypothetical protein